MTTQTPEQEAQKRAERQKKRIERLRREMRKDVQALRNIIRGNAKSG